MEILEKDKKEVINTSPTKIGETCPCDENSWCNSEDNTCYEIIQIQMREKGIIYLEKTNIIDYGKDLKKIDLNAFHEKKYAHYTFSKVGQAIHGHIDLPYESNLNITLDEAVTRCDGNPFCGGLLVNKNGRIWLKDLNSREKSIYNNLQSNDDNWMFMTKKSGYTMSKWGEILFMDMILFMVEIGHYRMQS